MHESRKCGVKVFLGFLVLHFHLLLIGAYTIEIGDVETKLNRILENEIEEKAFLRKLMTKKSGDGEADNGKAEGESVGILNDLVETSQRMEWLMNLLADLKTLLQQTIDSQQKEKSMRVEIGELREEVKYLRDEIQGLKSEEAKSQSYQLNSKIQTKVENDEKKIEWLTSGLNELRHEVREVSSSLNVTMLFHLSQVAETETKETKKNMETLQKDLEKVFLAQAQLDEDVVELRGDVADIRTARAKFGQRFIHTENLVEGTSNTGQPTTKSFQMKLNKIVTNVKSRHEKKRMRAELNVLETTIEEMLASDAQIERRLRSLEDVQRENNRPMLKEVERIRIPSEFTKKPTNENEGKENDPESHECSLVETKNELEILKVEMAPLKESTQTLFKVLEALETKYDGRMNEFQGTLSRIDVSNNALLLKNDDIKDQQTSQLKTIRRSKEGIKSNEKHLGTMNLRLATLQTQILRWGIKTCADETRDKAQELRIAVLEEKIENLLEKSTAVA